MNYKLERIGNVWNIIETSKDNQIVLSFDLSKDRYGEKYVRHLYRNMQHGNVGFNGWTPTFMTKKIDTSGFDESC